MFLSLWLLLSTAAVQTTGKWYYPIAGYTSRESYKNFGQLIGPQFYAGKTDLFPNKFLGYHAGRDIEIRPDEKDKLIEVRAVGDGKISYMGQVSGYGGLILEQLDGTGDTALYGHLRLETSGIKSGSRVSGGEVMAYLGTAFSKETGGERKHLHFGIYKGSDLYFKGYEQTEKQLTEKWIDPTAFLEQRGAVEWGISPTPTTEPATTAAIPKINWIDQLIQSIRQWWTRFILDKRGSIKVI